MASLGSGVFPDLGQIDHCRVLSRICGIIIIIIIKQLVTSHNVNFSLK